MHLFQDLERAHDKIYWKTMWLYLGILSEFQTFSPPTHCYNLAVVAFQSILTA